MTISFLVIAAALLTGCSSKARSEPKANPTIYVVPNKTVLKFNSEFIAAGKYAKQKGWKVTTPRIPSDNTLLINRGLHICSILDQGGGKPQSIRDELFSRSIEQADWDLTLVISKAAASSLCTSHKSRVDEWFYSLE